MKRGVLFWFLGIIFILLMCSCRSIKYVPVETVKHDTTYINKIHRDSIYEKDSIYVHSKNDTIYIEKLRYKYVDKLIRDTTYINKTDSIRVPYPVEKKLSKWESIKMDLGGFAIAAIIITIIIIIGRIVYFLKK